MSKILFLAFVDDESGLPKSSLEALSGACELTRQTGASLAVGLAGANVQAAADSISGCGAAEFLGVESPEFAISRYSTDVTAIATLVQAAGPDFVVTAQTARSARCMPGVAFRSKGRIDTHVSGFGADERGVWMQRWYYRQRMMAELRRVQRPWFVLLDSGVSPAWSGVSAEAKLTRLEVAPTPVRTSVIGLESASAGAQTIRPDAKLLFVAGAGWTKKQADGTEHVDEAEEIIRSFVSSPGVSLGSSKSLVDQTGEGQKVIGLLTHLHQVGQTGSTPRHPKGLATCCHGEEPHAVGWRFIGERRAVNLDPNCGWARGKADVLYVADAFAVMAKVNELLAARSGGSS